MDSRFKKWVLVLLAVNLLDAVTTVIGLSGGIAKEMNPLMAWVWAASPALFLTFKMLIPLVLLHLLVLRSTNASHTLRAIRALVVIFSITVLWNAGNLAVIHALT